MSDMSNSDAPATDYETRLERWETCDDVPLPVEGSPGPILELAEKFWDSQRGEKGAEDSSNGLSLLDLIRGSREIVFDIEEDGTPVVHLVMYCLASDRIALRFQPMVKSVDLDEDGLFKNLALASIYEVPVVPNTKSVAPKLTQYHWRMLTEGFRISDNESTRYILTEKIDPDSDLSGLIDQLTSVKPLVPAEVDLIRERLKSEVRALSHADHLISSLSAAIESFESGLSLPGTKEAELQELLTDNPILFGLDYQLVKPKYRLGTEYEMDYALIRWNGQVDLVEIEASTKKLFTKRLDPAATLVHAEQQVIDWLQWMEKNHAYARENLPGLMRPVGYIVIGRDSMLSSQAKDRLSYRNRMFGEFLEILTYDSLLSRAKTIKAVLTNACSETTD